MFGFGKKKPAPEGKNDYALAMEALKEDFFREFTKEALILATELANDEGQVAELHVRAMRAHLGVFVCDVRLLDANERIANYNAS